MSSPDHDFELSLIPPGTRFLLGIDEVGRGPLAGPVTIGAFLLDLHTFFPNEFLKLKVRDSKRLSATQRTTIRNHFSNRRYAYSTFSCSSTEIDQQGIGVCIYSLISKALKYYSSIFDFCLIDGNYNIESVLCRSSNFDEHSTWNPTLTVRKNSLQDRVRSIIKGDSKCFSVAAASIVAKVDRDTQMDNYHTQYPQYGFISHKGYGTASHLKALKVHGPCPIHRHSFKPISKLLSS